MGQSPANSKRERGGEGVTSHSDFRNQSAMEYLMTYGWAILIVAVILGALWSLGIFSAATFTPKVPPGSCRVFRPGGYASTQNIALTGQCSGVLPQFVAQFNGASDVSIAASTILSANLVTLVGWVRMPSAATSPQFVITSYGASSVPFWSLMVGTASSYTGNAVFYVRSVNGVSAIANGGPIGDGNWHQIVGTRGNGNVIVYVDGVQKSSLPDVVGSIISNQPITIGGDPYSASNYYLIGTIANVQIYNTSLSSDQVQYLYQRGIGGAPIALRNIVGWWPLNGDANDYSGLNNNGAPANIIFNGTWVSGYTIP